MNGRKAPESDLRLKVRAAQGRAFVKQAPNRPFDALRQHGFTQIGGFGPSRFGAYRGR
jgi:hypothetical protein